MADSDMATSKTSVCALFVMGAPGIEAARLRAGDPEPYLAHGALLGRLSVDDDSLAAKRRLLEDWWQEARRIPTASVMLAGHRLRPPPRPRRPAGVGVRRLQPRPR